MFSNSGNIELCIHSYIWPKCKTFYEKKTTTHLRYNQPQEWNSWLINFAMEKPVGLMPVDKRERNYTQMDRNETKQNL